MAYRNQQDLFKPWKGRGIGAYQDLCRPELEIARYRPYQQERPWRQALLFENTGTDFPVLMNAYGSAKRMCMPWSGAPDDVTREIEGLFHLLSAPKKVSWTS